MSNDNIFLRCISTLLLTFMVPILVMNLLMFFGVTIYIDGIIDSSLVQDKWDFDQYYFGFQSIISWLQDYPKQLNFNNIWAEVQTIIPLFEKYTFQLFGTVADDFINAIVKGFTLAFNMFVFPVNLFITFGRIILWVLRDIGLLLFWCGKMLAGLYNLPLPQQSDYWMDVSTYIITTVY